jgi:hypothetical protein
MRDLRLATEEGAGEVVYLYLYLYLYLYADGNASQHTLQPGGCVVHGNQPHTAPPSGDAA